MMNNIVSTLYGTKKETFMGKLKKRGEVSNIPVFIQPKQQQFGRL